MPLCPPSGERSIPDARHNGPVANQRLKVLILGSTGSIGTQALEVIAANPDRFEVVGLAAGGGNADVLAAQRAATGVTNIAVADPDAAARLGDVPHAGPEAATRIVEETDADVVLNALVGALGLKPTLAALRSGARLALANKESLIAGGPLVLRAAAPGQIVPVDSEHSALVQCLRSGAPDEVARLVLTASGGPFRTRDPATLRDVTPEEACAHPNWVMGRKISVDSATMMNKALEVIEARFLFGVQPAQIEVVIHPQSIIHSMVQYRDHSIVAQLGTADMRVPIAYGLSWPARIASNAQKLDFEQLAALTFESFRAPAHQARFPGLRLSWEVLAAPVGTPAILNAANEVAVEAFLARRIRFDQIHAVNAGTLERLQAGDARTLDDLIALDAQARLVAAGFVRTWERG